MNKSMLMIGLLVMSGLFFASAIPIPLDPGVKQLRIAVNCAFNGDGPSLFKSLNLQGNTFNTSFSGQFATTGSSLISARSALWACANNNYDCTSKKYIPFDALMQQASALYFRAGLLGVFYNGYSWYNPTSPSVVSYYNVFLANYRSCVLPAPG